MNTYEHWALKSLAKHHFRGSICVWNRIATTPTLVDNRKKHNDYKQQEYEKKAPNNKNYDTTRIGMNRREKNSDHSTNSTWSQINSTWNNRLSNVTIQNRSTKCCRTRNHNSNKSAHAHVHTYVVYKTILFVLSEYNKIFL